MHIRVNVIRIQNVIDKNTIRALIQFIILCVCVPPIFFYYIIIFTPINTRRYDIIFIELFAVCFFPFILV